MAENDLPEMPELPGKGLDLNDPDTRKKALAIAGVGGLGLAAFFVMRRQGEPSVEPIPVSQEAGYLAGGEGEDLSAYESYLNELAGSMDKLAADLYAYVDEQGIASQEAMEGLATQMADALGGVWQAVEEMYYGAGYGTEGGYYDYEGASSGYGYETAPTTPTGLTPEQAKMIGQAAQGFTQRLQADTGQALRGFFGLFGGGTPTRPEPTGQEYRQFGIPAYKITGGLEGGLPFRAGPVGFAAAGLKPKEAEKYKAPTRVRGIFARIGAPKIGLGIRLPGAPKAPIYKPPPKIKPPAYGPTPYRPPATPPKHYAGPPEGPGGYYKPPPPPKPKGPGGGKIMATPY